MPLTPSQQDAVQARGNVIVVAGAGTGKTSTLVERCAALLAGGCSIENVLLVTFTEAAAAEMRHRLRLRLMQAAEASTEAEQSRWWQEQLALLDSARICTLHGFCLQLVRENFHLLGLDPAMKVLDEQQTRPLIEHALEASLAPRFAGAGELSVAVRELIRRYGQGDVEGIRAMVRQVHTYTQTLPSPAGWFAAQRQALADAEPVQWRDWFRAAVHEWAKEWEPELATAAAQAANMARCALAVQQLAVAARQGTAACGPHFQTILEADADWPPRMKLKLRKPFQGFFDEAAFLASQCESTEAGDGLDADWTQVRPCLQALLSLTTEFAATFAAAKREAGGIDFADLEQFALRLLRDDAGALTPVARRWRAALEYVFVDECQDINAAQDAILSAISREASDEAVPGTPVMLANRFLVGDVKQSIYQFRLARPELFRDYERQWQDGIRGRRVVLAENFRSVPGIIRFVNALFPCLMRDTIGGVPYEPLVPGREEPAADEPRAAERAVEFHLIPRDSGEEEGGENGPADGAAEPEDLLTVEREACLVAQRLRELHESGLEIWDKEFQRLRRVEWRDMAVLLRSPRSRVEAFAQEFHKCGVPLHAAREGFLQSTEVMDLLSLLRLLDNPLQDIPLLAVLRSPLVAVSLDELAAVRSVNGARRFWTAVREFHRVARQPSEGTTLPAAAQTAWPKVDRFLTQFAVWRERVRHASLSQCLEQALTETDYESIIKAGERGAERAANVRKFVAAVRQYDPYQRQGLFRFLKFVESLEAAGQDLEPAAAPTPNAVRLMSIHQSKGLEFPVVVVACLGGRFNFDDLRQDILLDEKFGLGARVVLPAAGTKHPSLAHWLAARRHRHQLLGEELRLLYVAATRARDRLLLTATATRRDGEAWESVPPRIPADREILAARTPLDWLLLWLPTVTRAEDWQDSGGAGELLSWRIWAAVKRMPLPAAADSPVPATEASAETGRAIEEVKQRIRWQYPHRVATNTAAKTSVTTLRRQAAELADEDARPWVARLEPLRRSPRAGGAAEIGTLHHQFLQRLNLQQPCDEADLRRQLAALVARGVFSAEQAAAMELAALARFWQGDVGRQIRVHAAAIRRELPFTARFTMAELERMTGVAAADTAGEFVVVQGVADLVVMLPAELWLLDFKTDQVAAADVAAKEKLYRPQLKLYAAALAAIYGKPVTRCWLYFLAPGVTVSV
ncbi:MAG TPA: UvrD-helicase domain-containing protein [Verrucomicrobiae bacterium]|nr:UvrD-helicase domain-containing protein [Verrucomicrobiae bacterium]